MATQTVEFGAPTGRTITAKIFAVGSDTVVGSVTATEATNRLGTYTADFTDAAAGVYKIVAFDSVITPPLATWWVDLTLTTATFYAYEMPVSRIANATLSQSVSNVEDTMGEHTLGTAILSTLEWGISGSTLTIYKTDGTTVLYTKTLTSTTDGGQIITGLN